MLEVLALALWIPVGLIGVWLLVTGRRFLGLPKGLNERWPLRLFGLAYVLISGYLSYRAVRDGTYGADGLLFAYVALVTLALVALYRRRKARMMEASGPPA